MPIKALRGHLYLFKQRPIQHRRRGGGLTPRSGKLSLTGVVVQRKAGRYLERTADLASVPAAGRSGKVLVVLGGKIEDFALLDNQGWLAGHSASLGLDLLELGEIETEDVAGLGLVEGRLGVKSVLVSVMWCAMGSGCVYSGVDWILGDEGEALT